MSVQSLRESGKHLLRATLLVVSLSAPASFAADPAPTSTAKQPIVLEPSDAEAPAVVPLKNDGENTDADPLRVGDFKLIDQNGDVFSSEELEGHPWVASFIFTDCAGYCPTLVRNLRLEVVDRVTDPDVKFVTISVDPDRDTPERLKQYAEVFGVDFDRWTFLTGDKEMIYRVVEHGFRQGIAEAKGKDRQPGFEVAHSLSLMHVGPDGRVIGKYDSRDEQEVLALRRVLNGQIETPEENRVPPASVAGAETSEVVAPPLSKEPEGDPARQVKKGQLPDWAARLPATNAMLNGLATMLLLMGFAAIMSGNVRLHKRLMLTAFVTSIAFLGCYLTYHFALHHYTGTHGKSFEGTGNARNMYFVILISHVLLAMTVPFLASVTIWLGLSGRYTAHRNIARITFPIWLYVSVTGVIIYGMLYHWPPGW